MDSNLLYFVLGIIAMIPIELLVMPRLKKWYDDLPGINKLKRQRELDTDLKYITELHTDKNKLIATIAINFVAIGTVCATSVIMVTSAAILMISDTQESILQYFDDVTIYNAFLVYAGDVLIVFGYVAFLVGLNLSLKLVVVLRKIRQFDEFKNQTEARIKELNQR